MSSPSIKSNGSPDPEKQLHEHDGELDGGRDEKIDTLNVLSPSDTTAPVDPTSLWGRSLALSAKLERKVGIEARGIQRVPEGERGGGPGANFFMCVSSFSPCFARRERVSRLPALSLRLLAC
jgi:hypothetical protein